MIRPYSHDELFVEERAKVVAYLSPVDHFVVRHAIQEVYGGYQYNQLVKVCNESQSYQHIPLSQVRWNRTEHEDNRLLYPPTEKYEEGRPKQDVLDAELYGKSFDLR